MIIELVINWKLQDFYKSDYHNFIKLLFTLFLPDKKETNKNTEQRKAGGTTSLTSVYLASNVISGRHTSSGTEAYKVNNDVI